MQVGEVPVNGSQGRSRTFFDYAGSQVVAADGKLAKVFFAS